MNLPPKKQARGYVDRIKKVSAAGWASSGEHVTRVRAVLEGVVLAEGVTDKSRPDVEAALKMKGIFGFFLQFPNKVDRPEQVAVEVYDGTFWQSLPNSQGNTKGSRRYQDFNGSGASKSREKLKALSLSRIPNRSSDPKLPLSGLSVLDLGCNEGFFCREAVRLGASRVVGIDQSTKFLEGARKECPEGHFLQGTWWDLPDERFDLILFLSAIHYETRQRALLDKLIDHLAPKGTLVLECGVLTGSPERRWGTSAERRWGTVRRHDGIKRYPTMDTLREDLLPRYAMRFIGRSVDQAGDPVPRFVLHCSPNLPTVLLLAAESGSGKTTLAKRLAAEMPVFFIDALFGRLIADPLYAWRPVASFLRSEIKVGSKPNYGSLARKIIEDDALVEEICEIIASEITLDSPVSCIEGDLLRHDVVMNKIIAKLKEMGAKPWVATPR